MPLFTNLAQDPHQFQKLLLLLPVDKSIRTNKMHTEPIRIQLIFGRIITFSNELEITHLQAGILAQTKKIFFSKRKML